MALNTYHVEAARKNNLQLEVRARDFQITVDEPEASGGDNTGMNPVELLLSSIASCQTITALIFADFYGIKIDDIRVEVEGSLDPDGFSGMDPTVRPGFQNIRSTFHIKSSAPKVQLQQLLKMVEKQCPVGDSVSNGVTLEAPVLEDL